MQAIVRMSVAIYVEAQAFPSEQAFRTRVGRMAVIISDAVELAMQHLKTPLFIPVKHVDGVRFFNLLKKDKKVERMLIKNGGNARMLTDTTIIETVTQLRDEAYWQELGKRDSCKRLRYTKELAAKAISLDDEIVTIDLPAIPDVVETTPAQVLFAKPGTGSMYIEMSESIISYLSRAVSSQRSNVAGDTIQRDTQCVSTMKGVSMDYKQNKIRAIKRDADGKRKSRSFPIKTFGFADAVCKAEQFVQAQIIDDDEDVGSGNNNSDADDDIASESKRNGSSDSERVAHVSFEGD